MQNKPASDDAWADGGCTVREAADFAGVGRTLIYTLMDQGKIAFAKVGSRRVVARRSLRRLLEASATKAAA